MLQTGIQLQDSFTGVLYDVMGAVNLAISSMYDMQQALSADIDMSSMEGARDAINQATMALHGLNEAMGQAPAPPVPDAQAQGQAPAQAQWQSGGARVFTDTGAGRFQQEIASANQMMAQLSRTQDSIARQAYDTNLFPPEAFRDLNSMAVRVDAIRDRIQQIESNPMNMGTDAANAGLEQMRGQLVQAMQQQEDLSRAMESMDVSAANEAYLRLSQTVGNTERYIRDNVDGQGRFNREIEQGASGAGGLAQAIKGAVAAYATMHTLSAAINLSDQLTSTTARLDMMNDGLQTTEGLQDMIFLSAERSRGSYQATADAVSKLGILAGDAFSSNAETVAFMEQVNKQFTIAGTSAEGVKAAMLQLTQAMGSGILRGEEFNSIFEQAPNIIQSIADYMEVPKGKLKDMAAEGQITAEIVKAAMFAAADETNAKFESMPMTFGQIWTSFQNNALMAFQPVLERMNEVANSESFQGFVGSAIETLSLVAGTALEIFDLLLGAAGILGDNWSWLSPIIYGVVAALAVYYGAQLASNAINAISKGIHVAMAVAQMMHAAATGTLTAATAAGIAAQNGLNAALYACPVVWIIMMVAALVAVFYAAVAAVNHFAGTSISATGLICGIFAVAAAFIGNLFVTLINFVIDIFCVLWNFIASFANFFGNVLNDPVNSIARLFFDLADCVLGILESLASAIDTIFGSNLAGAVSGWRGSLGGWVDKTFGQGEEVMAKMNGSDYHLDRFDYSGAWDAGYGFGQGLGVGEAPAPALAGAFGETANPEGFGGGIGDSVAAGVDGSGAAGDIGDIAGNTGAIKDAMDITQEDLKYLRDIAEQETVNRFTLAEVHIEQNNNNNISSSMDLDGIVDSLTNIMGEAVGAMAEGVHM